MSAPGVLVDLEKVEALMSWERPKVNLRDTWFLGLAGYYERHENGRKLSIRDRILGFHLRDIDSMVGTTLTIEREIKDTWNTRDTGVGSKREDQLLLVRERGKRLLLHAIFRTWARIEHE